MGSGSSSNVRPLDIPKAKPADVSEACDDRVQCIGRPATEPKITATPIEVVERPSSNTKKTKSSDSVGKRSVVEDVPNLQEDIELVKTKLDEVEAERDELKLQNEQLEKQMGELESHNLDLVEQLQVLEEQLEKEHRAKLAITAAPCVNTVAAKDQYIAKLEKETKAVQEEIAKLKTKYKKKMRQMNSQLSEAKHESSLNVFEMKDELQRLKQENNRLQRRVKMSSIPEERDPSRPDPQSEELSVADRMGLIVELSGQVSAQENKIMELEQKIRERDRTIDQLLGNKTRGTSSKGKRTGSGKSQTSVDIGHLKKEVENDDWSVDNQSIMNTSFENENAGRPPPGTSGLSPELSEMRALARDMKQLQKRKTTKKKNLLKDRAKPPTVMQSNPSSSKGPDSRESSGTSRDSGVVSADSEAFTDGTRSQWMNRRSQKGDFDLHAFGGDGDDSDGRDEGLELQSFNGTPSLPKTVRTASPESIDSRWTDDEQDAEGEKADVKSTVSIASIRRISAPKKKKKHVLSDQDLIVDSLLKDFDEPMGLTKMRKSGEINTTDSFHALTRAIPATGQ